MPALIRVRALSCALLLIAGCYSVENLCEAKPDLCSPENFQVEVPEVCLSSDLRLAIRLKIDASRLESVRVTLSQTTERVEVDLQREEGSGLYVAMIPSSLLRSMFHPGVVDLQITKEPSFGVQQLKLMEPILQAPVSSYVDPGNEGDLGSFPGPVRLGVRREGTIISQQAGRDNSNYKAWIALSLKYDGRAIIKDSVFSNGQYLSPDKSPFTIDVLNNDLIVTQNYNDPNKDKQSISRCTDVISTTDLTMCRSQSDPNDMNFNSLMTRTAAAVAVHSRLPWMAYVDGPSATLFTAAIPDATPGSFFAWKRLTFSTTPSPTSTLTGIGSFKAEPMTLPGVIVISQSSASIYDLSADGRAGINEKATMSLQSGLGTEPIQALAVGDLDGNSLDDIVYVQNGRLRILLGDASDKWHVDPCVDVPLAPALGTDTLSLAIGDINADMHPDLVVGGQSQKTVTAYLNRLP